MTKRNLTVDFLKAIGLVLIVLAHIDPPKWLFNIRVMDVCMMVFASGLTLRYHGSSLKEYVSYLIKRFRRLIIPTWIFLALYFAFSFFMSLGYDQWKYSLGDYIKSFTFTGGIDYIWIIRVYFLMAIVSPLILKVAQHPLYRKFWFAAAAVMLVVNELLAKVSGGIANETLQKLFQGFLVYTLGYSIVELFACSVKQIGSAKLLLTSAVAFLVIWAVCGFVSPQNAKYPPQALYILYGLAASLLVCWILEKVKVSETGVVGKVVLWLSQNSLWIYFWHIFPVTFISKMGFDSLHFLLKYGLVLVIACVLTMGQNKLKKALCKKEQK